MCPSKVSIVLDHSILLSLSSPIQKCAWLSNKNVTGSWCEVSAISCEESKHDAVWMHLTMYGGEVVSTAGDRKSAKNAP